MADLMGDIDRQLPEKGKRRRGRPPGSTSNKRRHLLVGEGIGDEETRFGMSADPTNLFSHKLAQKYQESAKQYEKTGFTQRVLQVLRRMACGRIFAFETQRGPVLQLLIEVSKKVFLTELELVVWDMYLTNANWSTLPMSFPTVLCTSAYFVKSLTSAADLSHISAFLSKQNPQFQAFLSLWVNFCGSRFTVNAKDLNARFRNMLSPMKEDDTSTINYNYYVDEIINLGSPLPEDIPFQRGATDMFIPHQETFMQAPVEQKPAKPTPRVFTPIDTSVREDMYLASPMMSLDPDFGPLTPLLMTYPAFGYYTPPQSALPVLEDLESASIRPQADY